MVGVRLGRLYTIGVAPWRLLCAGQTNSKTTEAREREKEIEWVRVRETDKKRTTAHGRYLRFRLEMTPSRHDSYFASSVIKLDSLPTLHSVTLFIRARMSGSDESWLPLNIYRLLNYSPNVSHTLFFPLTVVQLKKFLKKLQKFFFCFKFFGFKLFMNFDLKFFEGMLFTE